MLLESLRSKHDNGERGARVTAKLFLESTQTPNHNLGRFFAGNGLVMELECLLLPKRRNVPSPCPF